MEGIAIIDANWIMAPDDLAILERLKDSRGYDALNLIDEL